MSAVLRIAVAVALAAPLAGVTDPLAGSLGRSLARSLGRSLGEGTACATELVIEHPLKLGRRAIELEIHMAWYYGYGYASFAHLGAAYGSFAIGPGVDLLFPVVRNGFIPTINNAFYVGFFADPLFHVDGVVNFVSFAFGPMAQWRFFLLDMFQAGQLSVFANAGFGIWTWFPRALNSCVDCSSVEVTAFPLFQVGGNFLFTHNVGLRVSLGYPSSSVGLDIAF